MSLVITNLLERSVMDFPHLLDLCVKYFRLNEQLVKFVDSLNYTALMRREDFAYARTVGGSTFLNGLLEWRQRSSERPEMTSEKRRPVRRHRNHKKPNKVCLSVECPPVGPTRSTTPPTAPRPIINPLEFVPLTTAGKLPSKSCAQFNRVDRWTRRPLVESPPRVVAAPWVEATTPPTAAVVGIPVGRKQRSISSRWFGAFESVETKSVVEVMSEEREQAEIREAIRLVEMFERRNTLRPRH